MMNSVELLKERLRATLSEPIHPTSQEQSRMEHPDDAYQSRIVSKSKSANYGHADPRERRARWVNEKGRRNNIPSQLENNMSSSSIYEDCQSRDHDSGFQDQETMMGLPQYQSADETRNRRQSQGQNSNEPLNYKNRWRYRGSRTTRNPFRSTCQQFIDIIDEDDTEGDDNQSLNQSKTRTLTRQNGIRPSIKVHHHHHSPNHSPSSISSESEGECENSHDPSSMLNASNEQADARRKQSIFFASYGVWSEESVMNSIRDLSPVISSVLEAAWCGQVGTLEELFKIEENVLNINCRDAKGRTPLHLAAACGHVGAVELLLQKGAQVDPCDAFEKATPLMCAAASASLASVEILLAAGANVNAGYDVGKTPLHWAVQAGSVDCAKRLLEAGAKQNPPLVYSENPLHIAASTGDAASLQLLIDYGADVSLCKGSNRSTALHIAAEEGNAACIRVLLKVGASHAAKDARGHTPLHVASAVDAESTSVLLASGADPNATDRDGRTPLHCSVSRGSRAAECVRLLVENQAEINCSDIFGFTPLHLAAVNESSQCASILLRHGADVTAKNKAGTTALSLLVRKIPDVMRFLVDRLDGAVTIHDHEPGDPDCEIRLDFRAVVPNSDKSHKGKAGSKMPEQPYYHNPRKETEFLTCVLAAGYKKILSHPLSEAFLTLKWQRVRKFFWASLLFQVALILLFTIYVIEVYLIKCPARGIPYDASLYTTPFPPTLSEPQLFNSTPFIENSSLSDPDLPPNPRERFKRSTSNFSPFSFNPTSKPKNKKNGGKVIGSWRERNPSSNTAAKGNGNTNEIGLRSFSTPKTKTQATESETPCTTCDNTNTEEEYKEYRKQCHSPESWLTVIWCLLIAFTAMMAVKEAFQLLQSPFQYVLSSENWGQWALISSVLIAAWPHSFPDPDRMDWQYPAAAFGMFLAWGLMLLQVGRFPALGLYVQMLGKVAANFGLVILAYACLLIAFALAFCVIFPGEPAYFSIPLALLKVLTMMVGEVDYETLFYDEEEPLLYPITAHVLHGGFVIIVTIVLMNLLVGLAVSDIQGLQKGAKLNRLSRQTALISRLESFIFSKKLQAILPKSVGLILQRSALLVPSSYNWSYYFRPNDPRDKRLPKELKQAGLRLAASRHSSRHTVKVHSTVENKQQFPVVNNVNTEIALRRMEQRLDTIQTQMDTVLRTLSGQMESMMEVMKARPTTQTVDA